MAVFIASDCFSAGREVSLQGTSVVEEKLEEFVIGVTTIVST